MNKIRYLTIIFILFCGQTLFAQRAPAWGGGADQTDYSFGFTFQYMSSYFKIDKKPIWQQPYFDQDLNKYTTDRADQTSAQIHRPGLRLVSFFATVSTEHLEARTTPGLVFADRTVDYTLC